MDEKLIRDALGSPVPQHYNEELDTFTVNTLDGSTVTNGDIDFSQTKLLRDRLGSVIPQVWDAQNHKWVVVTTQNSGGGEVPSSHKHEIADINGLQDRLDEVFQQVSSGKSLLETAIESKGVSVSKIGEVATFEELRNGILSIVSGNSGGDDPNTLLLKFGDTSKYPLYRKPTQEELNRFLTDKYKEGFRLFFSIVTDGRSALQYFATNGTYYDYTNNILTFDGQCFSFAHDGTKTRTSPLNWSAFPENVIIDELSLL